MEPAARNTQEYFVMSPSAKSWIRCAWRNIKSPYLSLEGRRMLNNLKIAKFAKGKEKEKTVTVDRNRHSVGENILYRISSKKTNEPKYHIFWQLKLAMRSVAANSMKYIFAKELVWKNLQRIHHWRHFLKSQFERRLNHPSLMSDAVSIAISESSSTHIYFLKLQMLPLGFVCDNRFAA